MPQAPFFASDTVAPLVQKLLVLAAEEEMLA